MSRLSRQITVIGAGNVGGNTAYFLSERAIGTKICLYDALPGRAGGKALDMIESQPIRRSLPSIRGCDSLSSVGDSQITVVALTTDMFLDRADTEARRQAVLEEARRVAAHLRGYHGVVVVASDFEQQVIEEVSTHAAIDAARLMGLGTVPHTMYAQHVLSKLTGIDPSQIRVLIIGDADAPRIVTEGTQIAAIPFARIYPDIDAPATIRSAITALKTDARSNYYRMAAAAARVIEAIDSDLHRVLTVASFVATKHDAPPHPVSLPVTVSADGVRAMGAAEIPMIAQVFDARSAQALDARSAQALDAHEVRH